MEPGIPTAEHQTILMDMYNLDPNLKFNTNSALSNKYFYILFLEKTGIIIINIKIHYYCIHIFLCYSNNAI